MVCRFRRVVDPPPGEMAMTANWLNLKRRYWLLAACALCVVIIIALIQTIATLNRYARRTQHTNALRQIAITLAGFDDTYDSLPPAIRKDKAGRPLCSWRFQTLPFLQSWMGSPAMEFGEPWDSPANRYWADLRNRVYCWSSEDGSPAQFHTNV